jgi:hypothetical protein
MSSVKTLEAGYHAADCLVNDVGSILLIGARQKLLDTASPWSPFPNALGQFVWLLTQ